MSATEQAVTYLFSDIEGSTRLWENESERMRPAVAHHFAILDAAIARHNGVLVKKTGDGVHAAFDRPADAVAAVVDMQLGLREPHAPGGIGLKIRCGLHWGLDERRDGDFYGPAVNRAARIMSIAHGGQTLISQAVAERARAALPAGVTLRDLGTVRLRDLSTPERVYQVVHAALRAEFPALRSLEATPNNLAQQLNSFVGRERELQEVRELLARNRLVTLLGMGGLGKSRLSVQLAAEVLDDFPDGVWMIELAPLVDAQLVPHAVAKVLGIKEDGGQPIVTAIERFLRDRRLLLILDNCEHVVAACAELAKRLLQSGPALKILATSRDYLAVAGETTYHVPTLSIPQDGPTSVGRLSQLDAVRLFIDRTVASRPDFRITEKNAPYVADICRRLDGIPLAIELAAARMRALSAQAISARLNDRFRLLVSGDKTVLPRQRTLRALIDWSYELLTEQERALFQRLSVFAGGWTLEAAELVGRGGALAQEDILDVLAQLVEKSLVTLDPDGQRYRMLETVRQYAAERLEEDGDAPLAEEHHFNFFLGLAEQARPEIVGRNQAFWLTQLDLERENLLAAYGWSGRPGQHHQDVARLVFALKVYCVNRGLIPLWHRLSVDVLTRPALQSRDVVRCQALAGTGQISFFLGRDSEARRYLSEALSIARELGDLKWTAGILQPLGMACLGERDYVNARAYLTEAIRLASELGNRRELAGAETALAMLYRLEGKIDEALPLYRHGITIARELGDQESIAIGLLNFTMASIEAGTGSDSAAMLREALEIVAAIGSKPVQCSALEVCAGLAGTRSEWALSATLIGAADEIRSRTGLRRDPADEAFVQPFLTRAGEILGETAFASANTAGRAMTDEESWRYAYNWVSAG